MEDTLRDEQFFSYRLHLQVLILVLMEDTLRGYFLYFTFPFICLNPCFNGRYSQRSAIPLCTDVYAAVLILVLMEDTLRDKKKFGSKIQKPSLNPCFNGRYSQSAKTCVPLFIVV